MSYGLVTINYEADKIIHFLQQGDTVSVVSFLAVYSSSQSIETEWNVLIVESVVGWVNALFTLGV